MTVLLTLTHLLAAVVGVVLAVAYSRKEIAKAQAGEADAMRCLRARHEALADLDSAIRFGEGA